MRSCSMVRQWKNCCLRWRCVALLCRGAKVQFDSLSPIDTHQGRGSCGPTLEDTNGYAGRQFHSRVLAPHFRDADFGVNFSRAIQRRDDAIDDPIGREVFGGGAHTVTVEALSLCDGGHSVRQRRGVRVVRHACAAGGGRSTRYPSTGRPRPMCGSPSPLSLQDSAGAADAPRPAPRSFSRCGGRPHDGASSDGSALLIAGTFGHLRTVDTGRDGGYDWCPAYWTVVTSRIVRTMAETSACTRSGTRHIGPPTERDRRNGYA